MQTNAHTPIVIRAHCEAHLNRYGPCPACQRATLAALQTQMAQATGLRSRIPTASALLPESQQKNMAGNSTPVVSGNTWFEVFRRLWTPASVA